MKARRRDWSQAFEKASSRAAAWLRSLEVSQLDSSSAAMQALGLLLCQGQLDFMRIVRGSGAVVRLPCFVQMIEKRRTALLRLLNNVIKSREVDTKAYSGEELTLMLGGLGSSYARSRDLTAAATIVRAAGALKQRSPMLDEVCEFLLDQQTESGAFGLLTGLCSNHETSESILRAQLRATTDVLSALNSYMKQKS